MLLELQLNNSQIYQRISRNKFMKFIKNLKITNLIPIKIEKLLNCKARLTKNFHLMIFKTYSKIKFLKQNFNFLY